jgi:MFS family permease
MIRNLKLFPLYLALIRVDFWLPVFFLYFLSLFSLDKVLLLEAIYYISVVFLEVPSGYFSDRVGRKWTLVAAASSGAASGFLFFSSQDFYVFCVAQFFYAVFMAFNSGSDSSLLYDTLKAEGREGEMLALESQAHAVSLFVGAFGAVVGGCVALLGYKWVYALSGLAYVFAAFVAMLFKEPVSGGAAAEKNIISQLGACRSRLADTTLRWMFFFYVGRTIFEHIPYEFFQPYLGFVVGASWLTVATGAHQAVTKLVSSYFAHGAGKWKWSATSILMLTHAVTTGLILLMALWVHPVVVLLLLFRNIPHGLGQPVMNAAIHPLVPSGLRATYLSLQSLAGRLSFAITLGVLSFWSGPGADVSHQSLSGLLIAVTGFSAIWLIGLQISRPKALS